MCDFQLGRRVAGDFTQERLNRFELVFEMLIQVARMLQLRKLCN